MALTTALSEPIELKANATESDLQVVISAVYKQVLGNKNLFSAQRLESAEARLRNGDISVRGFVRMVAQSELYQSLFFASNPPYRFIELNCKHLLGRAPLDQAEISTHTQIYNQHGYAAEIDSYIDSDDYIFNFNENIVPYALCTSTQTGVKNNVFNRTISLLGGFATSDNSKSAQLLTVIAANLPEKIKVASSNGGATGSTNKRFCIAVSKAGITPIARLSKVTYQQVAYNQLSKQIQSIHKSGAKILSITETV